MRTNSRIAARRKRQRGFSLIELAIATLLLLVGVVAVMQLVPRAMQVNLNNRFDSSAMVRAQRLLDQMINQPISATQFTDDEGRVILLGDASVPGTVVGAPMNTTATGAQIDFDQAAVPGYNFTYVDPNEPTGVSYEVRWAVITQGAGGIAISKRYFVGVWKRDPGNATTPVTVQAWVQR